jgi:hypothetical protein
MSRVDAEVYVIRMNEFIEVIVPASGTGLAIGTSNTQLYYALDHTHPTDAALPNKAVCAISSGAWRLMTVIIGHSGDEDVVIRISSLPIRCTGAKGLEEICRWV